MWKPYFDLLADTYRVITPDSRGQGRTTIGDGPVTYGRMAGDLVRLLDHLDIPKTHVVGFSDGGTTTLHLLVDYPDRVSSATLIGTSYHTDNYRPDVSLENVISGHANSRSMQARYAEVAPDPEAWPELIARLGKTWVTQPTFSDDVLGLIDTPVLVVKVDSDQFLAPEVFDGLASLIPRSRTLYLPEGTHSVPREQPRQLADGIRTFVELVGR